MLVSSMEKSKARTEKKGEKEEGIAALGKFVPSDNGASEVDTFGVSEEQQGDQTEECGKGTEGAWAGSDRTPHTQSLNVSGEVGELVESCEQEKPGLTVI